MVNVKVFVVFVLFITFPQFSNPSFQNVEDNVRKINIKKSYLVKLNNRDS